MMDLTEYVILPGADYKEACDAVREKTGKTAGMKSGELAQEIRGIKTKPKLQEKTVSPSKSPQEISADAGYDGLSRVNIGAIPGNYIVPGGTISITENGEYDVTEKAGVVVAVEAPEPVLQSKTVSPAVSDQTVSADSGYDGLSSVTVEALKLQEKNATPSETAQTITPDAGFDGLSKVIVGAAQAGTDVSVKTGFVTCGTRAVMTTVGFRPDLVMITGAELTLNGVATQLACLFPSQNATQTVLAAADGLIMLHTTLQQTSTGFRVGVINLLYMNGSEIYEETVSQNLRLNYTAVKYTE